MKAKNSFGLAAALVALVMISGLAIAASMDRIPAEVIPSGTEIEVPQNAIDKSPAIEERLIVPEGYSTDKAKIKAAGCTIVHELSDALAIECPKGTSITGAIEDKKVYAMDIIAGLQINADDVWALGYTGSEVTVAVLDTGIDYNHVELSNHYVGGYDYVNEDEDPLDDNGHGTHCSGIITATGERPEATGAAPDTKIWAGKVLDASGSGYTSDIALAIQDVVDGGKADIISMSLGGGGTTSENCDYDYLAQKVNWAAENGVTVVVAAGNNARYVSIPGCASGAIAVGAVDKNDIRASFSGRGLALDIMAPGVSIYSTYLDGGYAIASGTSMATPHVAAVVAMMKQKNTEATDSEIKDALYTTAVDLGSTGWDKYYGWGRVDALGAVNAIPSNTPCTLDSECNDGNECTTNTCNILTGKCEFPPVEEGTTCSIGLCCSGICTAQECSEDINCNDNNACTVDACSNPFTCGATCTYTSITQCISGDGCCPAGCSSETDSDCTASVCVPRGAFCNCDGSCNKKETIATCPWDCK
ncbi:MAG: S8 family peptidase [Candidatus Aenigmarchaeota archaeon]|nr:S8 family peptidase [Candidatus Aenigmarchaeota archaeon]